MPSSDGADTEPPDDLDAAIGAIYGGPLDEFVTARDGLARELRAAGRRDDATAVRKLAKPRRLAWALDAGEGATALRLVDAARQLGFPDSTKENLEFQELLWALSQGH